ncbi:hypothetical protein GW17_00059452 [Ensete ventricosum]|nr:hypothetical protein GW17_00059452 [Ensete ventricosum]
MDPGLNCLENEPILARCLVSGTQMRQAIAREVLSVDNEEGRDCVAAIADGGRCNGRRGRRGSGQVVNWKERLVGRDGT